MSEELYQYRSLENMVSIDENYKYLILSQTTFNDLIKKNIIQNNIKDEYKKLKPDGLILSGSSEPYKIEAVIENKSPEEYKKPKKKQDVLFQAVEKCYAVGCNLAIVSNGLKFEPLLVNTDEIESEYTYQFNNDLIKVNRLKGDDNQYIVLEDVKIDVDAKLMLSEIIHSLTTETSIIRFKKEKINPTELAKKVWQSVWLATGDSPKKCLMTFTEIFMYKYLSDLGIIAENEKNTKIDFNSTYEKGKDKCLKFYLEDVRPYIKDVFPKGVDDTTIINGLSLKDDKNQDELFFEILKDFKEFGNLKNVSVEFKSNLFEEFLKGSNGIRLMAQFFTPRNIIRTIVNMAEVDKMSESQSICDPSCGVGGFLQESIIKRNVENEFSYVTGEFNSCLSFNGYDLDKDTIILAKASMTVLLSGYISKYRKNIKSISEYINSIFHSTHKSMIGSLSIIDRKYDLILSNPPYVRKGLSLYNNFIKNNIKLESFYSDVSTYSKEGLFVVNIIKSLKDNGRAFIILPDGFFHTKSDRGIRDFLLENCYLNAIISLPERTFYTTSKKTYILAITKKRKSIKQEKPVFNYIVKDVGETLDYVRSKTSMKDLELLISEYKKFIHSESYQSDNECIFTKEIDYYKNNNMWLSENIMGKDGQSALSINDFSEVIDIVNNIGDSISETVISINNIENNSSNFDYIEIDLSNKTQFDFYTSLLGMKQKEYREIDVTSQYKGKCYPVYTAASKPVAFFKEGEKGLITPESPHISIATDGDGTAGTNIIFHKTPYFLNTSRLSIIVLDKDILPEYVFYSIRNIKQKFGFGFSVKCNKDNLKQYCKIRVPIDSNGNISLSKQIEIVKNIKEKENLLNNLIEHLTSLDDIKKFSKYLSI